MSAWTEPMKVLCRGRCGDVGDPPCWELPRLSSDCATVSPCEECTADRIAALEAELREARKETIEATGLESVLRDIVTILENFPHGTRPSIAADVSATLMSCRKS